jgi:hypothetical protein
MQGQRAFLFIAAATVMLPLFAAGPSAAATLYTLKGARADLAQSDVEQVARRCRYESRGRLRCRGAQYRVYPRYYYNPYAYYDYGYYPRFYGFGHHHGHH